LSGRILLAKNKTVKSGDRPKASRIVIGLHACLEVFNVRKSSITNVSLKFGWSQSQELKEIADICKSSRIPIQEVSLQKLDSLGHGHQGIALSVTQSPELDWASLGSKKYELLAALDGIEDPQNLGAMLRSAWLMGVGGVIVPSTRSVGLTPVACKVASGAAEHVPVSQESQLQSPLKLLSQRGFWIFGLSEKASKPIWDLRMPEKVVWVVGSEGSGIKSSTLSSCDELVTIPQESVGPSYNASVAFALAIGETRRQWRIKAP
jgi:23S rRNA (guanosine2251-2'-O)-methyltransferase